MQLLFIDTGSEITLIKECMKEKLKLHSFRPSSRTLRGASGHSFRMLRSVNLFFQLSEEITCNHTVVSYLSVIFPGDVLLVMDWLCCFNFRLVGYHSPIRNYVTSNGLRVKLSYNDCRSLAIKVITVHRMPNMAETGSVYGTTPVLCAVIIVCPLNTGIFCIRRCIE